MRYSLRTLVILSALGPPLLAVAWAARAGLLPISGILLILLAAALLLGVVTAVVLLVFGY
jgi:hypothetical protein